jgi:hypothetical protein
MSFIKKSFMKKQLICVFTIFCFSLAAQEAKKGLESLCFSMGKNIGSFSFSSSDGTKDENLQWKMGNTFGLAAEIKLNEKQSIKPGLLYYETGAQSTFLEEKTTWQLNYIQLSGAYLYRFFNKGNLSLRAGALLAYDYLLKAEQSMGSTSYDLKEQKIIKSADLSVEPLVEAGFKFSENSRISFEYRFKRGFNQIENKDQGEKAYNIGHKLLFTISFNLK